MRWPGPDGYWVSDDRALLDMGRVHQWLSTQSYWAEGRSYELVARSFERSLVLGLYGSDDQQAGVCRWVTDSSTFGWLCDVFVEATQRGSGLGSFLVRTATSHPAVQDVRQVLGTRDAHDLYRRFGFVSLSAPDRWMERRHEPYRGRR